ncbi:MAG: undecaprenyldiphospho-muramoylpentapeptide beta-N-acetylglucosaminyltransferase [Chloroflexi bacterium]|nr:undecaprenyldiphospho-muramoylpentapeptide beta-N-acetylglucosaminyltransferase [Chloroflexota bacterium]
MRLLICAGGTGGGVYPALAVLQALKGLQVESSSLETLWVGGEGGMEAELVKREGIPFAAIPAAGLHGVGLRALPRNITQLARGVIASQKILRGFKPDVLFFTGGFVSGPMAFAGRNIPTLLFVPDIEPGLALKSLARFADCITVSAADSQKYFSKQVIVTGYPLRAELKAWTRSDARRTLGLNDNLPVLLIYGGSKGAHSINLAVLPHLPGLLEMAQVVHITGQSDWETAQSTRAGLTSGQRTRYHAFPYLHEEMGAALASADLVVSRAGASTLGEFPFFGLPAILIPYPYAWRYQKVNADHLAERSAAVIIKDEQLQEELLLVVKDLLENPSKRKAMSAAMRSLAKPQAAQAVAGQLLELGGAGR